MGYVKVVKNKNYYKRYKVRMRRRRECKTNYNKRRVMVRQDKRKYNAPKWRFIVRISNNDVTCQVACAKTVGDQILCAAYSHELPRYGLKVGLTNYAACYCTGLLLARRLLKKLRLDKFYPGKKRLDGKGFRSHVANVNWKDGEKIFRPFKCLLDVGLARCTTGARIFGALKGAVDGGLDIPHSAKRFPGFVKGKGDDKNQYDASKHYNKIFGQHVKDYMKLLQDKDLDKYNKHFSKYIENGVEPDNLEDLYEDVHKKIRADPDPKPKVPKKWQDMQIWPGKPKKLKAEDRRERRLARIQEYKEIQLRKQAENEQKQDIA
mmetsp:Transcript_98813/g.120989  ORF Transcript_98813/g.120989 Transcript_98813/m.120989 type:complete len:320 (-) Transcript_98813:70-1029(-)